MSDDRTNRILAELGPKENWGLYEEIVWSYEMPFEEKLDSILKIPRVDINSLNLKGRINKIEGELNEEKTQRQGG